MCFYQWPVWENFILLPWLLVDSSPTYCLQLLIKFPFIIFSCWWLGNKSEGIYILGYFCWVLPNIWILWWIYVTATICPTWWGIVSFLSRLFIFFLGRVLPFLFLVILVSWLDIDIMLWLCLRFNSHNNNAKQKVPFIWLVVNYWI